MAINYRTEYQRYRQYYVNLRRFYQKPTVKVSFFVLLSFATVTFFTALAIRPTITTIGALIRDIEDKRQVDDLLEAKITALDEVQGVVAELEEEEELLKNALPEDAALGKFLQELEYLAQQHQVSLTGVSFASVTLGQTTTRKRLEAEPVSFTLDLAGNFTNVAAYLKALERLDRVVIITNLELKSGVTAAITGQVYYVPPQMTTEEL